MDWFSVLVLPGGTWETDLSNYNLSYDSGKNKNCMFEARKIKE